jgi:hypothetical protein
MIKKDPVFLLCDRVRETAFGLQKYHRHGHAVEDSLTIELKAVRTLVPDT